MSFQTMGKFLIFTGLIIVIFGVILMFAPKIPYLGKLPGDIIIRRKTFTFYFPLVTCLLISIVLTILLNLIFRK
ncbi:conserved hypothetical protein, membrane [Candidatus Desulfofervidus auxilii]|uniref:DUF2905 domain-containing protein n=1 Tax=Desulfofervidus auxilii TaxID=1621989 RepID=A0A7C1ZP97_DESA2|nr:DUF2905 domain-containing protein [Candidatus Desulfofervidus auxilii]CAD7769934.1 hypothetical protein BLFGPEAP_00256 [Candidatus Methanoperedenaceae archaeon GB50]CAD7770954.1 hypothetical protein DMNBHIDG_00290 [Candidatus Methanoperedenaceae archaeon GB37]AMM40033.1 conserved hypothetical protein, membrane [Candidatus Desulfofervidus auxilii]MDL1965338.1 DUF2905 domain-containing protein [Candidatus Desulfofervidus auxilii]CAD7777234.1 MAG: hypothetical protein KIIPBIDF_00860 [Candidatu